MTNTAIISSLNRMAAYQLLARRAALKLEVKTGLRSSSRKSIAQVCREAYGIKHRPKAKVLEEMDRLCEELLDTKGIQRE